MNKDFHYEGTFAAARIAGYSKEAAAKIAWAAQAVDDCTKENMKEHYSMFKNWGPIYTCETITQNVIDNFSSLGSEDNDILQDIRRIWMPFHFLPGNTRGLTPYEGTASLSERDQREFLCMCLPDSDLAAAMVQRTAVLFQAADANAQDNLLILIGIVMHVLADTWAHQYFTGAPNSKINCVDSVAPTDGLPEGYSDETAFSMPSSYSIVYLGHGQIGHNPDYGCMQYDYHPCWAKPGNIFHKNGPSAFCSAFKQMEWALRYIRIRTNTPFSIQEQHPADKPWMVCVKDVVTQAVADQSAVWKRQMADFVDYSELPDYSFAGKKYEMPYFQAYAKEHQAFVMGYLESALNILNIH